MERSFGIGVSGLPICCGRWPFGCAIQEDGCASHRLAAGVAYVTLRGGRACLRLRRCLRSNGRGNDCYGDDCQNPNDAASWFSEMAEGHADGLP